ncbi:MAG: prolipoprotein diacylglyceryl transferase [Chloroflexi bacterium]|nr:prolipoprotein diacylglyceryl transferase [Chloroflexota bacterium]
MIEIPFDPIMLKMGPVLLSWHGFFTLVGVVAGVALSAQLARVSGINPDYVYNTAIWGVLAAIIGARFIHVIDHLDVYAGDPLKIFAIYQGGIAIWGAVLGGFVGGVIYTKIVKYPTWRLADIAAPGLILGMAIGRIGDIINGEHCALVSQAPWAFVYTHIDSPAVFCHMSSPSLPMHPAVVYEMFWDLLILGGLLLFRGKIAPAGMSFVSLLGFYAIGRFFISFLRDDRIWFLGLQESQVICILVLVVTVPLLAYKGEFRRSS